MIVIEKKLRKTGVSKVELDDAESSL